MTSLRRYQQHNNKIAIRWILALCILPIVVATQDSFAVFRLTTTSNMDDTQPSTIDYTHDTDPAPNQNSMEPLQYDQQSNFNQLSNNIEENQIRNSNNEPTYKTVAASLSHTNRPSSSSSSIRMSDAVAGDSSKRSHENGSSDPANSIKYQPVHKIYDTKRTSLSDYSDVSLPKHQSNSYKHQIKHKKRKHNHKYKHHKEDEPQIHAPHISYYDNDEIAENDGVETTDDMMKSFDSFDNTKWSNSHNPDELSTTDKMYDEGDDQEESDNGLPSYIKKLNKRNKQLLDLLEGPLPARYAIITPKGNGNYRHHHSHSHQQHELYRQQHLPQHHNHHHHHHHHHHHSPHYQHRHSILPHEMRKFHYISDSDLHADELHTDETLHNQPDMPLNWTMSEELPKLSQAQQPPNNSDALPVASKYDESLLSEMRYNGVLSPTSTTMHPEYARNKDNSVKDHSNIDENRISPRTQNFIYHRVAASSVGVDGDASNSDGTKKKRLPFVAITDRRLSKQPHRNSMDNQMP